MGRLGRKNCFVAGTSSNVEYTTTIMSLTNQGIGAIEKEKARNPAVRRC